MIKPHQIIRRLGLLCMLFATHSFVQAQHVKHSLPTINMANTVNEQSFTANLEQGTAEFTISIDNTPMTFALSLNTKMFSKEAMNNRSKGAKEMALYKGSIVGKENTWARFSVKNNRVTGAYFDGESLVLLRPYNDVSGNLQRRSLRGNMRKMSEQNALVAVNVANIEHSGTCALHDHSDVENFGYQEYVDTLRSLTASATAAAGAATRQISINLFADTEFVNTTARNGSNATQEMLENLNIADGIFVEQLGIQLVLNEAVELTDNGTLISSNPQTLVAALKDSNLPNPGLRHLFTDKDLTGSTVGIAYVGSLCRASSAGVTQRINNLTPLVFTHELGHNFNAPHDNQSGSACVGTPNGFVMSPNVSNGGSRFSACSVPIMTSYMEATANRSNSCISDVVVVENIEITSIPNVNAELGLEYSYDSDNTLDVSGTGPFTYQLDIAPANMMIDQNGVITWTPRPVDVGSNFVQITVLNATSQATQIFEVAVTSDFINIKDRGLSSFTGPSEQDLSGGERFGDNPLSVELSGNTWKQLLDTFVITPNTVLEFEFSSTGEEGEIQGIGFDNNNSISADTIFAVHGTQTWGRQDFRYTANGVKQTFTIPVGEFFTGNYNRLVLVNDNDRYLPNVTSVFSNIRLYETTPEPISDITIDFNQQVLRPFLLNQQDRQGTALPIENGTGVELTGNKWQRIALNNIPIASNTVIEFEFKSTIEGEIHGIGFFPSNRVEAMRTFQLHGNQDWGLRDFTYTGNGEYQRFVIPVGDYLTQSTASLVFIMDNDDTGSNTADSSFRNIVISSAQ